MLNPSQHFKQHHYLVINSNPSKIIVLQNWQYIIGRDSVNHIVLKNDMISRYHATLEKMSDLKMGTYQYKLIDGVQGEKPSFNGIYVNGNRIQECQLKHGDKITFGGVVDAIFYSSSHLISQKDFLSAFEQTKQFAYSSCLDESETTTIML